MGSTFAAWATVVGLLVTLAFAAVVPARTAEAMMQTRRRKEWAMELDPRGARSAPPAN
jgi:hypothetical protein